jgi:diguanylate cyclase (GGDEF)-like protein
MDIIERNMRGSSRKVFPIEVYDSVVRSLHGDRRSLFVGMAATWICGGLIVLRSGSIVLGTVLLLMLAIGLLRMHAVLRFEKRAEGELDLSTLKHSERSYGFWASAFYAALGLLCFLSMAVTSDELVHLMAMVSTMAYVIGIAGRNFASSKVVNAQVLAVSVPLIMGLILFGGPYHIILACLLVPFLFASHSIANRLREMLFNAVFVALDHKTIADRFEVALENASHGMAMLDHAGTFMVVNSRFNQLFGIPVDYPTVGTRLSDLRTNEQTVAGELALSNSLSRKILNCLAAGKQEQFVYSLSNDVNVEVNFNPMNEGAGVLVLEDITERVKSEHEIRKLANFDSLTQLANRRYFTELVNQRFDKDAEPSPYSLFFADLDNFKDINDSLGHPIGDKLLCAVSLRMKSCMPDNAMICRFGGDEFVILLPGVIDRKACAAFAGRLIEEISKPILIEGTLIIVGSSVGISLCPEHAGDLDQLLKMADLSLYESKAHGRGNYHFYTERMGRRIKERRKLEVDLRRAVQRGELSVYYQPLIDIKSETVGCCEALVRWHHPELGNIPPSDFIPMAEEIGIISKIGKFVMEAATIECARWPSETRVAVNVSSLQFRQSDVASTIAEILGKSGLSPTRLEVEVTESAVLEDLEQTSRTLRTLAQGGVRISLDDFGTGFSSLSYLHQLPLNKVKMDRSFVESIRDDERSLILLSGVTQMAADLGLRVIVEGVEEQEQLEILKREVHFDEVQGYLFGKAMPAIDIRQFLVEFNQNADKKIIQISA